MWLPFPVSCGTVSQCLSGGCGLHYVLEGLFTSLANQSILIKFRLTHSGPISCRKRSSAPTHTLKHLHEDWRQSLLIFVQTCAVAGLEFIFRVLCLTPTPWRSLKLQKCPQLLHIFTRLSHHSLTVNKSRQEERKAHRWGGETCLHVSFLCTARRTKRVWEWEFCSRALFQATGVARGAGNRGNRCLPYVAHHILKPRCK